MDILEILEQGEGQYLPNLSIDLVIIGYRDETLRCLLLKIGNKWVLPGGFIGKEESVEDAVQRNLMERAGLTDPHLKFLSVFGNVNRRFNEEFNQYFKEKGIPIRDDLWITNRFVTLAYYSLVDIDNTHPKAGPFDEAFDWFDFDQLPELWLDHETILRTARERLKEDIRHEQITYNLLAKDFTMPQLHKLHQTILEKDIDRSRFQKKMLASGMFERLPQIKKESPGRNPYQYTLKMDE